MPIQKYNLIILQKSKKKKKNPYCFPPLFAVSKHCFYCHREHCWEAYCLCVCAGNFAMVGIWGGCSINTLCARGESRLHKHTDMPTYNPATAHAANQRKDTQPWQADRRHSLNSAALYDSINIHDNSFLLNGSNVNRSVGSHIYMFPDNHMHQTSQTQSACNSHSDHWQHRCRSCGTLSFVIPVQHQSHSDTWQLRGADINGNQGTSQCVSVHFVLFTDRMMNL